jgi:hypothetical protein
MTQASDLYYFTQFAAADEENERRGKHTVSYNDTEYPLVYFVESVKNGKPIDSIWICHKCLQKLRAGKSDIKLMNRHRAIGEHCEVCYSGLVLNSDGKFVEPSNKKKRGGK